MAHSSTSADRNLLFGILAMQMDFISRDQLIAAMQAWVFDKSKPLGDILVAHKALAEENRTLIEALVQKHLAKHNHDAEKSLAAVSSVGDIRKDLAKITDRDVQASLVHVPAPRADRDQYATVAPTPGLTLSTGMRFRIVRPHARGGLGEVFVARDEELHREVALKEIQERQADNPESRTRFLMEAEITGGLEHPGIVPVYGLGTYADGRPYYAMRFIRGDSLKEAIERFHRQAAAGMSPGERALELRSLLGRFVDVCNAIAYAHSRGVLHRDLKPGNIMLGKYGETLVVDWGLAKPVGQLAGSSPSIEPGEGSLMPSSMSAASQTLVGSAVGTPQYMSPEQAGGRLDQLGPASDVYSLGATLYCVLTGVPPIGETEVGVVLQKVQRGDIPRPREVNPDIPPALEAICVKAMQLRPTDRYPSPKLLADDIEHWLADEPVTAWKEPWTVTAKRWIGRNMTLVTSVASAVVIGLVSLVIATILLVAANERERQAKLKADANYKLARSAVDRYHTGVSESVLLKEPGMDPLRKELLAAAREFYEKFRAERAGDADVQGELGKATYRLARITADIESQTKGIELHHEAATLFETLPAGEMTPDYRADLAASYHYLGQLYRKTDQIAKAEEFYQKALGEWEKLVKDQPAENRFKAGLARSQFGLGNVYLLTRRLDLAQKIDEQSLENWKALVAADSKVESYQRDRATCELNLGLVYLGQGGKEAHAEAAFTSARAIQKQLADDSPHLSRYQADLGRIDAQLGNLYLKKGITTKAEEAHTEAVERWQAALDRHPTLVEYQKNLATSLIEYSKVYWQLRDWQKAEGLCLKASAIQRRLAEKHQDAPEWQGYLAWGLFTLGETYRQNAEVAKAEKHYQDAKQIQERIAPANPKATHYQADLARTLDGLGTLYAESNRLAQATETYQQAVAAWSKLTNEHPDEPEFAVGLSGTDFHLGALANIAGNHQKAVDWYSRALDCLGEKNVRNPSAVGIRHAVFDALRGRAEALMHMDKWAQSLPDWDRAVELAPERMKPAIQLPRALALAHAGRHVEAAQEADRLVANAKTGESLYRFACLYALCASAAASDVARPEKERTVLAQGYAFQAMKRLEEAQKADQGKFFQLESTKKRLRNDPNLNALREREDFKKLVEGLK